MYSHPLESKIVVGEDFNAMSNPIENWKLLTGVLLKFIPRDNQLCVLHPPQYLSIPGDI